MSSSTSNNFFHGLQFVFVMSKLGKVQLKILRDKIKKFGGAISDRVNGQTTHLMFHQGVSYESGLKSLNITSLPGVVSTVTTDWLSNCIAARNLLPTKEYKVSFNFQWMRVNAGSNGKQPGTRGGLGSEAHVEKLRKTW